MGVVQRRRRTNQGGAYYAGMLFIVLIFMMGTPIQFAGDALFVDHGLKSDAAVAACGSARVLQRPECGVDFTLFADCELILQPVFVQ